MPTTLGLSLALLVVSPVAMAKQTPATHHHPAPSVKAKPTPHARARVAKASPRRAGARWERVVRRSRDTARRMPAADEYIGPVSVAGQRQIGRAAWYGNQHIGRLTSSGERLDTIHATAAHRSLPLHSLARVTNLRNGRSVVVRINDRGPVSRSLLIDMSPRAAAALNMIDSGIAEVMIEPVVSVGGVGSSAAR